MKINPASELNHEKYHIHNSHIKNILVTLSCRLILIALSIYLVQIISCAISNKNYSLFTLTLVIILDTAYVCIKRKGIDFKWFSPAYFAFSAQIIISAWLATLFLLEEEDINCLNANKTVFLMSEVSNCGFLSSSFNLCELGTLYLSLLLIAILTLKRFTPIDIPEKMHSKLYIGLISSSADIVDFVDYSNDNEKLKYYGVNFIWGNIFLKFFFHEKSLFNFF